MLPAPHQLGDDDLGRNGKVEDDPPQLSMNSGSAKASSPRWHTPWRKRRTGPWKPESVEAAAGDPVGRTISTRGSTGAPHSLNVSLVDELSVWVGKRGRQRRQRGVVHITGGGQVNTFFEHVVRHSWSP